MNAVRVIYNQEAAVINKPFSVAGVGVAFKSYILRRYLPHVLGRKNIATGSCLIARLLQQALKRSIDIRVDAPMKSLIQKDGKVCGVVAEIDGENVSIAARKGVIIAAGGFGRNQEMREKYLPHPTSTEWTCAMFGDMGQGIQAGIDVGADTALMDDTWGGPVFKGPYGGSFMIWERSNPHSIMVDGDGNRFMDESASYTDCWHWTYESNEESKVSKDFMTFPNKRGAFERKSRTIPSWLIFDQQHRDRYVFGVKLPFQKGIEATRADTLEELASKIGVPYENLKRTVDTFNGYAKTGRDIDFKRGDDEYDRFYSDPACKPNPNLGTVAKAPFYAREVYPGELSTKGGLLCDEYSRVLDKKGKVIEGLYCTGNSSASVMGRCYPGPGASVGAAMVFGYIAGKHATGQE